MDIVDSNSSESHMRTDRCLGGGKQKLHLQKMMARDIQWVLVVSRHQHFLLLDVAVVGYLVAERAVETSVHHRMSMVGQNILVVEVECVAG